MVKYKTLTICTLCTEEKAKNSVLVPTTGIVKKKTMTGKVCPGYQGQRICGCMPMVKA